MAGNCLCRRIEKRLLRVCRVHLNIEPFTRTIVELLNARFDLKCLHSRCQHYHNHHCHCLRLQQPLVFSTFSPLLANITHLTCAPNLYINSICTHFLKSSNSFLHLESVGKVLPPAIHNLATVKRIIYILLIQKTHS